MSEHAYRLTRRTLCKVAILGALALTTPTRASATEMPPSMPSATFTITPPLLPTLQIEHPSTGQLVGDRIEVVAHATNVAAVMCRVDGGAEVALGYDAAAARWRGSLDATALVPGTHRLLVTARGKDGTTLEAVVAPLSVPAPLPAALTYALTIAHEGPGRCVATPGGGRYTAAQLVAIAAQPDDGALLIGWQVDGGSRGWGTPLQVAMDRDRAVIATFAARPAYRDVVVTTPHGEAIAQLAARGIVRGYVGGMFGPDDTLLRCQLAVLLVRAMNWSGETAATPFSDRSGIDDELWRAVGILAARDVARGYGDGTYGTLGAVLAVQVVAFVARAMVARGYWAWQSDKPDLYPAIPTASGHRRDLATFVRYAGMVTGDGESPGYFAAWERSADRGWFASILWQAVNSQFGN